MAMAATPSTEYDLLADEWLADPYPLYAELRESARVHWSASLGGWALLRHDDVHDALNHPDLSAARFAGALDRVVASEHPDADDAFLYDGLARWFTFADPPMHTRLRRHARRVFSAPMKAMHASVARLADELLEPLVAAGGGDLVGDYARPLSVGAIAQLLGVPRSDYERFTAWSDALTDFIGGALGVSDRRRRALDGLLELEEYLRALIHERRKRPTADLLGALAAIDGEDAPTDAEIASIGAMVLFAGHGTTTNLLGNGTLALLEHPDQLERLRRRPDLLPAAVEELLRYDSPVQLQVRNANRDGALGHEEIAAGDRVFLFIGAANRDPAANDDPDVLDIARASVRHLTFGYGIHFCLGAPLARIEAPIAFGQLIEKLPGMTLGVPRTRLRRQRTVGFRGLESLPIGKLTVPHRGTRVPHRGPGER